jgi:Kef-type K+ transport system membrane component KefB
MFFAEEIGCGTNSTTDYVIAGCPDYPDVYNDVQNFVGTCTCKYPTISTAAGPRILTQIVNTRLSPEMGWILEPWLTGPPYNLDTSFTNMCNLLLDRIWCPEASQIVIATDGTYTCSCGTFKAATAVQNLIVDQVNKLKITNMPVFANPVYLSVSLSLCIILIVGKLGAIVACYFKLPAIIGYLLVGLGMQNFLSPMVLKGVGFPYPSVASELKTLALILVLMRAGLAVDMNDIKSAAVPTLCLSIIPYISEFFGFMYTGVRLNEWSQVEMGLFASMMAALGPSVVIPPMLGLLSHTKKNYGYVPKQVLLCAPLEAVIALVLFSIFTILNQSVRNPYYPWVGALPLWANCILIPVNITFSAILGTIVGWFVSKYINWRVTIANDVDWMTINKNLQMGSSTADLIFVLFVACYTMMSLATLQYIQQCSGVLVVFMICVSVSIFCDKNVVKDIAIGFKGIWVFAEVFLFTFVGTNLTLDHSNGILMGQRGMSGPQFKNLIACMLVGTCARFVGHVLSTGVTMWAMPPHRRNAGWMGRMAFSAWTFQLPKATVQATVGGLAYTQAIIPGIQGVSKGFYMLQSSAITILFFASLGSIIATYLGAPVALQCSKLDLDAGWDNKSLRYFKTSPFFKGDPNAEDDDNVDDAGKTIEMVPTAAPVVHLVKSAAGFLVPEEEGKKRRDTLFDVIDRAVGVVSGPPEGQQARRRSSSGAIRYVLTGAEEAEMHRDDSYSAVAATGDAVVESTAVIVNVDDKGNV